ncbi:MAG: leucine-rich repeat domain-containing protein [Clostridia bacterium]|nr:leucine-rich repeat domain-containing protein [Clostridia bacterium]
MAKHKNNGRTVSFGFGTGIKDGRVSRDDGSFAYTENMYIDHEQDGGALESIPGFRKLVSLGAAIHSIFVQKCAFEEEYVIVHAGTGLYRFNVNEKDVLDTLNPIATVNDTRSHAFNKGGALFVMDGEHIVRIMPDGSADLIDDSHTQAYVPTTFKNGKPFEQRNLLTASFKESYVIKERDKHYRATPELQYHFDDSSSTCSVIGIDSTASGSIYIPKYAKTGDKYYRITEIRNTAFAENQRIVNVYIADGLTRIGRMAFYLCKNLRTVYCPSSIEMIDNGAFLNCYALTEVFIGKNLKEVGMLPFSGADSLETIHYEMEGYEFDGVINKEDLSAFVPVYSSPRPAVDYYFTVRTKFEKITSFTFDGNIMYYTPKYENVGSECRMYFTRSAESSPEGVECTVFGTVSYDRYNEYDEGVDFISRALGDSSVISACTRSVFFDGRIFLSGNPKYPNTVFYSLDTSENTGTDLYFGSLSYFDDGAAGYETSSLCATSDALVVMKVKDDGGGGIFYHEGKDEDGFLQRTYPVSYVHTGLGARAEAISNLDETFLLCDTGVYSLKRGNYGLRSAKCISEKINSLLLKNTDLSSARFTAWNGYIVLQIGSEIYLADLKSGSEEIPWYYLTGIGAYKNNSTLWDFMSFAPDGYLVNENPNKKTNSGIHRATDSKYGVFYYINDADDPEKKYAVYLTGEYGSGTFYPADCVLSVGNLLFFGTTGGDLCVFNNDKRGVPPPTVTNLAGFNEAQYKALMGDKIHPYFYDFCSRRVPYVLRTKPCDCGLPGVKKSTVPSSFVIKTGAVGGGNISCKIRTDDREHDITAEYLPTAALDFHEINFESLCFDTDGASFVYVNDDSKNWLTKEITISSDSFRAPISISEISYRYKTKK